MKSYFLLVPITGLKHSGKNIFIESCVSLLNSIEYSQFYDNVIHYSIFSFKRPIDNFFFNTLGPEIMNEVFSDKDKKVPIINDFLIDYKSSTSYHGLYSEFEKICKKKFGENIFAMGLLTHLRNYLISAKQNDSLLGKPYIHIVFIPDVKHDVEERFISTISEHTSFKESIINIDWIHIIRNNYNINLSKYETEPYNFFEWSKGNHHRIENITLENFIQESITVFQNQILQKFLAEIKRREQYD